MAIEQTQYTDEDHMTCSKAPQQMSKWILSLDCFTQAVKQDLVVTETKYSTGALQIQSFITNTTSASITKRLDTFMKKKTKHKSLEKTKPVPYI